MNFDPTIRLDFLVTIAGVIVFVLRLQTRLEKLSEANARMSGILEKLEERLRKFELTVAAHVGVHEHEARDV
jgi:hypothetical protein